SSRRRHTRLVSDWSSDVCSSDLWTAEGAGQRVYGPVLAALHWYSSEPVGNKALAVLLALISLLMVVTLVMFSFKVNLEELAVVRSEERRVGKECRSRWWT